MRNTVLLTILLLGSAAKGQELSADIQYGPTRTLQALDVYVPDGAQDAPVVLWIHGGGWQTGDKKEVHAKPRWFTDHGLLFVSTNYRLWPQVEMDVIVRDVAQALGWVYRDIAKRGGDPQRIFIMGHSAGAQLAALLCTDHRYVDAQGVPSSAIKGCVPIDGDTYDIPAIILTAEMRQTLHGLPLPTRGHRIKFGNDPEKHASYSAVTHVARNKGIPPFLIMHVAGHPDVTAQAQRFAAALQAADVPVTLFAANDTNHRRLNAQLGEPGDRATQALLEWLDAREHEAGQQ
jgi:acetyl esterase/lipase